MKEYNFLNIEKKWQEYWEKNETFKTDVYDFSKPKYYCLDMFPYPSGNGLHVGHPEGYTATDIISRMKRMQGYNVLHPMGWDAFGLPAEQFAIQTGNDPQEFTYKNIETFKKQLKMLGFSYDWSKEFATCDKSYYKHTQYIFSKLYENGLAKLEKTPVNWCEKLNTVLANDEIVDGKSERGGYPVEKRYMDQWVVKTPMYAEKLLSGLNNLDWPKSTIEAQRNWIGKSCGVIINFKIKNSNDSFEIFTTRPDTIFGVSYCVLAPEHKIVSRIKDTNVEKYVKEAINKSEIERLDLTKEKTGVFSGLFAINPVNNKEIPIYISDYVLSTYATGAVMAVPSSDKRDYEFAKKFNLEIISVIEGNIPTLEDNKHIISSFLDGLYKNEAIEKITKYIEDNNLGKSHVYYKLRDWTFARQRYWGEPIPIIFKDNKTYLLNEKDLPLELPKITDYKSKFSGQSPLANSKEFVEVKINNELYKRETNTMPGSAASSFYFMRFIDPKNENIFCDYELLKHWMPVDLYIGGKEHAVGHLLYSRFLTQFLYDINLSPVKEPFKKLVHQGLILGENNEKMSKSRGNVVNPDDIVKQYGADSLRLYEMFMGPLEMSLPWVSQNVEGSKKFLDRVWRLFHNNKEKFTNNNDGKLDKAYNLMVKKVTQDFEALKFNTAISQMMVFVNECYKQNNIYINYYEGLIKMLSCICPHISEELWQDLGHKNTITFESWPIYNNSCLEDEYITLVIQINGKLKNNIKIKKDLEDKEVEDIVLNDDIIKKQIDNKEIKRVVIIKNKLVNIVC